MNETEKESGSTEAVPSTEGETSQAKSGFKRFLRRVFRWTLGLLIVFVLGGLTATFILYRYQSLAEKLLKVHTTLEQAKQQIASLESERDHLARQLADRQARQKALKAELDAANLYITVLSALTDVTGARLALVSKDLASARAHLNDASATLDSLTAQMEQSDIIVSMQNRLKQALTALESDQYAAQSDLNVLANSLVQLQIKYSTGQ